jgi:uncharacterized protein (TIGR03083 family)
MIPNDTIDRLAECYNSVSELGAALTEEQWKRPSQLPAWTVQDNLSHLVGTERAMQGLTSTTHRAADLSHVKNPIGEANEHEVDARRGCSGAEVLHEWNEVTAQRLNTLHNGDDAYFDQPSMTPTGPGTLADFLHIRVLDCWVHEQDMRRALGMPGHLSGPAAEHTVDRLLRTIPIVVGKRAATPEGGAVVIDITDGVERHVVCEVQGGRAAIVAHPASPPLCTIALSTDLFTALATGRTTDAGAARVTGDEALATRILGAFNMMI